MDFIIEVKHLPTLLVHEYFPFPADELNLKIISYLKASHIRSLSLVSREMRRVTTDQGIWRQHIRKKFKIEIGKNSPILNISFYGALNTRGMLPIIPAIAARFAHLFDELWPRSYMAYKKMLEHPLFREQLIKIVDREDTKVFVELLKVDRLHANLINDQDGQDEWDFETPRLAPALHIAGLAECSTKRRLSLIGLAVEKEKEALLISLIKCKIPGWESGHFITDHLVDHDPPRIDLALKLLNHGPRRDRTIKKLGEQCQLSIKQLDQILPPRPSIEGTSWYLLLARHNLPYVVKHFASCASGLKVLEHMLNGGYGGPGSSKDRDQFFALAKEASRYFKICTVKRIDKVLKSHNNYGTLDVVCQHMLLEDIPKIAAYASQCDKNWEIIKSLQRNKEFQSAYINELPLSELRHLIKIKKSIKITREEVIYRVKQKFGPDDSSENVIVKTKTFIDSDEDKS